MADNSKVSSTKAVDDKADWVYVEVPEHDLFAEVHTGVSINFEHFGPGKHFVSPEKAGEIQRLVDLRLRSDMRVMQPNQDQKMLKIMERRGPQTARTN